MRGGVEVVARVSILVMLCLMGLPQAVAAQTTVLATFDFEGAPGGGAPRWVASEPKTAERDSSVSSAGAWSLRLRRDGSSPGQASSFGLRVPVPMPPPGGVLELRGSLRGEGLTEWAGLWLRQDGPEGALIVEDEQARITAAGTGWRRLTISTSLHPSATSIVLGATVAGLGTVWVDDLELALTVQGLPPSDDHEFDEGSRIEAVTLSAEQAHNLALLAKVWGFVKYHHPRVTAGEINWDYELFRALPPVLSAPDADAAKIRIIEWLGRVGEPDPCDPCAKLPDEVALEPPIDWIHDTAALGSELSRFLERTYDSRPADGQQRYVRHAPVGWPGFFPYEEPYREQLPPDAGYRMLSLFRLWNVVEYWFPYRDVIGEDWDGVLAESIPRFMAADAEDDYKREIMRLLVRVNDTHANLWGDLNLRPPGGDSQAPVELRYVEGEPVVTGYSHPLLGPETGLEPGDVVEAVDGVPVDSLFSRWAPMFAASNETVRRRNMVRSLTRGPAGRTTLVIRRFGGLRESIVVDRADLRELDLEAEETSDLPGPAFGMLSPEVAYLKLSAAEASQTAEYVRQAQGAAVWVIDIRGYPNEFLVFALGQHLVRDSKAFARFTRGDPANPGAFVWREPVRLEPVAPTFAGRLVVLVDENSMSQSEYTAMALRAASDAIVVGSTTSGADGDITAVPLPGRVRQVVVSGLGVFYPDGTPTQRIGIVPDLVVEPTIAGIREGRDEVLEAGVSRALGRPFRLPPVRQ